MLAAFKPSNLANNSMATHGALLMVSLLFGIFFVMVKYLLQNQIIDQVELILIRLIIASSVAMAIEFTFFRTKFKGLKTKLKVVGLGLLGIFLIQSIMVISISLTNIFHATLIITMTPIITPLLAAALGKEKLTPHKLIGALIAFAGVFILLFSQIGNAESHLSTKALIGDGLVLFNAFCFSLFLILNRPLIKQYNGFSLMAWWYTASAVAFTAVFLGAGLFGFRPISSDLNLEFLWQLDPSVAPLGIAFMLYIAIPGSLGTYGLNNFALKRTASSTVAMYIFLQPIFATALGIWLLNEPFTPSMLNAGVVVFTGVIIALYGDVIIKLLNNKLSNRLLNNRSGNFKRLPNRGVAKAS